MPNKLRVLSPEFVTGGAIPEKYTCGGSSTSPPLVVDDIPSGTKTLALVVEDLDSPSGIFDYWIAWNIPPTGRINERSSAIEGLNSMAEHSYMPPCPTEGTHTYHFKVYALDTMLNLDADSGKRELVKAMRGHTIARGELQGLYTRPAAAEAKAKTAKPKVRSRKTTKTRTSKTKPAKAIPKKAKSTKAKAKGTKTATAKPARSRARKAPAPPAASS